MYGLLLTIHILICLALIVAVLLQSGKGGGLAGGAFGGTAQTVFGGRGATDFITRATMVLGGAFFLTSLVLALISSGKFGSAPRSLLQEQARRGAVAPQPLPGQAPAQQPAPGKQTAPAQPPAGGSSAPSSPPAKPPGGGR